MRTKVILLMAALLSSILLLFSCSHSTFGRLVGNDRDEHGCIGSAGYTWSYALHSCVRLWEAGIRFNEGPSQLILIFSEDSTYAEIFPQEGNSVLCRRIKQTDTWKPRKGDEQVSIQNGILTVKAGDYTYTQPAQ